MFADAAQVKPAGAGAQRGVSGERRLSPHRQGSVRWPPRTGNRAAQASGESPRVFNSKRCPGPHSTAPRLSRDSIQHKSGPETLLHGLGCSTRRPF